MKLNLMTPINQLGYGVAGLNILKALQKQCHVSLFPIGNIQVTNQADADEVKKGLENASLFSAKAPCLKIWHQNQMAERIGSGKLIGFPIFELDTFSDLEKHHLAACDELMVCSRWAKDVVVDQVPKNAWDYRMEDRVHVVPLGVDTDIFKPVEPIKRDKTIFFNCGKWEIRKGHDLLIDMFKNVLIHDNNVELWMMCTNPFNSPDEEAKWTRLYSHPKIKIIPRAETQQEVYNIMRQVDCGVFPSRGEGWNLELLEMMAMGKYVIATGYSAHTEFCTKDNCGIIPTTEKEPAFDGKWFFGQGNWAKLDERSIFETSLMMRDFMENKVGTVNEAGIETAKKFSWDNTANLITKHLT
jgi:glycosyltransferase involved in cell wall biosynthesis